MYKVIVERPRRGGGWARPGREPRDPDDRPHQENMRHRLGMRRKSLNENLRPLQRWLDRQAGRRWDAVYSELCRHVDRRNTVQQHIHVHLRDFVAIDVLEIGGRLCVARDWGGTVALVDSRCRLYVDPRNGCLMRNDAAFAQRARQRRGVAQDARHVRQRLEVVGAGAHRRQQHHHQVNRLVVDRLEVDRGVQPREQRRHPVRAGDLAVRNGEPVAEPGRAQRLAIAHGLVDDRLVLSCDLGGSLGKPLK